MKPVSFQDLAVEFVDKKPIRSHREQLLLGSYLQLFKEKLIVVLNGNTRHHLQFKELEFDLLESGPTYLRQIEAGIELNLTMFGSNCSVILPSVLALEIVHRYLDKSLPVVDRELNQEEIAVVALAATLLISELRVAGLTGIYLKSVTILSNSIDLTATDIVIEETLCQSSAIIKLDKQLLVQLSQRSKLIFADSFVGNIITGTVHRAELNIRAEVQSLSTLFKLKPGVLFRLGNDLAPSIKLRGNIIGYGDLIINNELGESK